MIGQGGDPTSWTYDVIRLRTCLQMRSTTALKLSLTTVTCPAEFKNSPDFKSYNRDIDLLTR